MVWIKCLYLLKQMLQGLSRAEDMPLHRSCSLCVWKELRELKRFQIQKQCCRIQQRCFLSTPKREQVSGRKCLSCTCRETLQDTLSSKLSTQPCKSLSSKGTECTSRDMEWRDGHRCDLREKHSLTLHIHAAVPGELWDCWWWERVVTALHRH